MRYRSVERLKTKVRNDIEFAADVILDVSEVSSKVWEGIEKARRNHELKKLRRISNAIGQVTPEKTWNDNGSIIQYRQGSDGDAWRFWLLNEHYGTTEGNIADRNDGLQVIARQRDSQDSVLSSVFMLNGQTTISSDKDVRLFLKGFVDYIGSADRLLALPEAASSDYFQS